MEAVVLAGGKGTRLQPLTSELPKPLVTVGDQPVVEILLRRMAHAGVSKAHLAVNHLAHLIMSVVGDGSHLGLEVVYSHEDRPLSTVAPIKLIENLPDVFLVANGDILTDLNYADLYRAHVNGNGLLTIATARRTTNIDYGVLETDDSNRVTAFREKPDYHFVVSAGIYVFSKRLLEYVPDGRPYGFDELVLELLMRGERVDTYPFDGYWLDIGRPDDYRQANRDVGRVDGLSD